MAKKRSLSEKPEYAVNRWGGLSPRKRSVSERARARRAKLRADAEREKFYDRPTRFWRGE